MAGHGDPISILPVAGPLTGAELLVTVQDGETRQFAVVRLLPPGPPPGSDSFSGARAYSTTGAGVPVVDGSPIVFNELDYDTDAYYSTGTGLFTAPADGWYHLDGHAIMEGLDVGTFGELRILGPALPEVGGSSYSNFGTTGSELTPASGDCRMLAGDTASLVWSTDATDAVSVGSFSIHRIGPALAAVRHSLLFGATNDGEALVTAPLADSDTFTLVGWINLDSLPAGADENWMSRGDDVGDEGWSLALSVAGDGTVSAGCVMTVPALIGLNLSSLTPLAAGGWHHVAAVFASADSIQLYIDGVLDNSTAITSSVFRGASSHTKFGGLFNGSSPPIHGRLCDPAVWNRALDPADIAALATGATHPAAFGSGLLAYYPVFEPSGATIANAVSGGSPAILSGDVTINSLLPPGF